MLRRDLIVELTETDNQVKPDLSLSEKKTGHTAKDLELVEQAIKDTAQLLGRLRDKENLPGGLIMFPEHKRPIIIGDLHANKDNLRLIIEHGNNRQDLESGTAACILLGDAFHDDRTGFMKDMRSSLDILDDILQLFIQFPGNVYYLRGNHDCFDGQLRKGGIYQALEFRKELLKQRGKRYTAAIEQFFETLPYFIIGKNFVITHAGPPRGGIVREELVNIRYYPEKKHQLTWLRVNEFFGGNPSLKEYSENDLRLTLHLLDLPLDTHFIVGHNPIWSDGNKTGVWLNVIGIKNHHILYSGHGSIAPYITFIDGEMLVKSALKPKPEVYYYG